MKAKLVAMTKSLIETESGKLLSAEEFIIYTARVSNPSNQLNLDTAPKLLQYLINHKHWSPFEQVSLTFEVETSRAIAAQLLRHRSFTFQEFSQRYAVTTAGSEPIELRIKGTTNRQSSLEAPDDKLVQVFMQQFEENIRDAEMLYQHAVEIGIAPETARFVLPLATTTSLYVTGSVRSFIHYFEQRCSTHAQKEHRLLAESMRSLMVPLFPNLAEALTWTA